MNGAGGTSGGIGQFLIGFIMMSGGFYMLLNAISVTSNFALSARLYSISAWGGNFGVTGGIIMIPFMIGVGIIFFNARNILGWLLSLGSITALIFGVLSSIRFTMKTMTAFELIVILILAMGGFGILLRSLRSN